METKEKQEKEEFSKKKKVGKYLLGKIIGQGSFTKVRQGLHIIAREKVRSNRSFRNVCYVCVITLPMIVFCL